MKKSLIILICLITLTSFEIKPDNSIVGKWHLIELFNRATNEITNDDSIKQSFMEFNQDGTCKTALMVETLDGNWKIQSDKLIITNPQEEAVIKIKLLIEDSLILFVNDIELKFTRIRK